MELFSKLGLPTSVHYQSVMGAEPSAASGGISEVEAQQGKEQKEATTAATYCDYAALWVG